MIIRKAEEKDFQAILGLIQELAEFEKEPDAVTNSVEQMKQDQNYFTAFVAEEFGVVIGMAICFISYSTWKGKALYLDDLYVQEKHRGNKIGFQLLKEVFQFAKSEDCKRLRWQVLDWNTPAVEFYEKCGAGIQKDWYNCDFDGKGIQSFLERN